MFIATAIERFITAISGAGTPGDIHQALSRLTRDIGATSYLLGAESPSKLHAPAPELELITNYPDEWMRHYERRGLVRIDPLVQYAQSHTAPSRWLDVPMSEDGAQLFQDASAVRLEDGIVIPLRPPVGGRPAILCFATDQSKWKELDELVPWLSLAALHLSEAMDRIRPPASPLTPRQVETLSLIAAGKSQSMIARLLGISESTVKFHVRSIIENLGAANRANAVRLAMLYDLLPRNRPNEH